MGIRQRFKSAINAFRFTPENPPERLGGSYFYSLNKSSSTYNDLQLLKDWQEIPEVSAIVSVKAKAFSKMQVKEVSKATGKEMPNQQYHIKCLRNPNWFQSRNEFMLQTKAFREVFGNEYMYLDLPFGVNSRRSKAMFTLPPYLMETKTPDKRPFFMQTDPVIEYWFTWGSDKYLIPKEQMIHLTDNRLAMTKDNWVNGESWLASQRAPVNNIRAAYAGRGFILENVGVMGMLSPKSDVAGSMVLDDKQKEDLRQRIHQMKNHKDEFPVLFPDRSMDWVQMSVENPTNLGLFEEVREDFYKLCDAAGVSAILFSSATGATFENQKWAERRMYENTIIPEAEEWIGAMNAYFGTENESWELVGDFSHLNVFQENSKERGDAINRLATGLSRALADQAINVEDYRQELRRAGIAVSAS